MSSVKLDGRTLTSTEILLVAKGEKVEVASDAWKLLSLMEII